MAKILKFKSCAKGGEYTGLGAVTPTSYSYIGVDTAANIVAAINNAYADDSNLAGKVTGIGYGWQKYEIPSSGKVKFTVRGAAGGATGKSGYSINADTGAISGTGNRPGRGAKLVGTAKLKKGDILYMLVGMRGWCNNGADWGGGGGGASVVLLDNPAGAYTLTPAGRRVDVLFVAGGGGGCYDSSFGTSYYGKDAVITDGTGTGGGSSNKAGGGAGLTGNGGGSSSNGVAYNLLSGNIPTTALSAVHYGGWGGGGASYNGGGGGGGYSGGAASDSVGGNGGTSYINPTLCVEISRGYATVEEDGGRNLTNPWTAYGFIEIELGRDENKYILAKDETGYKYFKGIDQIDGTTDPDGTDTWIRLPGITSDEDLSEDTYKLFGKAVITNTNGLGNKVKFYISSTEPQEVINISGNVNGTVVEMIEDFSQADVSEIHSVTMSGNWNNVDIRLAFSKDYGKTWQTYNMGSWTNIDIHNKTTFQGQGLPISQWTTVPMESIRNYNAKTIRIAFCITQNGNSVSNGLLTEIKQLVDLIGAWRHFKEAEAEYEWATDSQVKVTFKQAGNYKVNYLDSIG